MNRRLSLAWWALSALWMSSAVGGCGTDGTTLGSQSQTCVAGQVYCSTCNGGGFCTAGGCPGIACPIGSDGGGGADAGGVADGGGSSCPANMPLACLDCNGGSYCVAYGNSGACPATTCPAGGSTSAATSGATSSSNSASTTISGSSGSSTCNTNVYCPYGTTPSCQCNPAPDAGRADAGAPDASSSDAGGCGQLNGPCCFSSSGIAIKPCFATGLTCCQGVPYPTTGVCLSQCVAASDYHIKRGFEPVDGAAVLEQVASLPVTSWSYDADDPHVRHMGPMAQEFREAFGLGDSDRTIYAVDGVGVSLAAIQALDRAVKELRNENRELAARNAELAAEVRKIQQRVNRHAASDTKAPGKN